MANPAPTPIDVLDFQFKLQSRINIFQNDSNENFNGMCNILATASRYGLLFVGTVNNCFQVIQLQDIQKDEKLINTYPRRLIELPSKPHHLSVNCDCTKLSVVVERNGCATAIIYDVLSFLKQQVTIIREIRLSSTPGVYVLDTNWNPALPDIFTTCKSDGSLGVYEFKGDALDINELPAAAGTTCFCWSPKGKQIAIGSKDGRITQYKPDLKAVKAVNPPNLGAAVGVSSLTWTSSFQFIAIYKSDGPEPLLCLIVVDAPKTGAPLYTNYEDICYSYGNTRPQQFYTILQQHWNILMVASSNSMEVGVLGFQTDKWMQWILGDSSRAELPLSPSKQDTLPVGLALSTCMIQNFSDGNIQATPLLLMLSNQGVLCCFNVIYNRPGIPSVCSPIEPIADRSGASLFVKEITIPKVEHIVPAAQTNQAVVQPVVPSTTKPQMLFGETTISTPFASTAGNQPLQFASPSNNQPSSLFNKLPTSTPPISAPSNIIKPSPINIPSLSSNTQATTIGSSTPLFGSPVVTIESSTPLFGSPVVTTIGSSTPLFGPPVVTTIASSTPLFGSPVVTKPVPIIPKNWIKPVSKVPSSPTTQIPSKDIISIPKPVTQQLQTQPTIDSTQVKTQPATPPPTNDRIPINVETEAMIAKLIRDECIALESELNILLQRGKIIETSVGVDSDATQMAEKVNSLEEFLKALKETSNGQEAEIHTLKQTVIQSWAWYEEARSRHTSSKDVILTTLIQAQPLDPASQRHLEDINHLVFYLDSQITQAHKALDEQWDAFQDSLSKNIKFRIPTMETIYQSMVKQNATLQKQKYILKDISNRVKAQKRTQMGNVLLSVDLPDKLEEELSKLQVTTDVTPAQYTTALERQRKFTKEKSAKLYKFFSKKDVTCITVQKPQLNNSTVHLTSLLAAPLSPIAPEKKQPVKSMFVMSTPKPQSLFQPKEPKMAIPIEQPTSMSTPIKIKERVESTTTALSMTGSNIMKMIPPANITSPISAQTDKPIISSIFKPQSAQTTAFGSSPILPKTTAKPEATTFTNIFTSASNITTPSFLSIGETTINKFGVKTTTANMPATTATFTILTKPISNPIPTVAASKSDIAIALSTSKATTNLKGFNPPSSVPTLTNTSLPQMNLTFGGAPMFAVHGNTTITTRPIANSGITTSTPINLSVTENTSPTKGFSMATTTGSAVTTSPSKPPISIDSLPSNKEITLLSGANTTTVPSMSTTSVFNLVSIATTPTTVAVTSKIPSSFATVATTTPTLTKPISITTSSAFSAPVTPEAPSNQTSSIFGVTATTQVTPTTPFVSAETSIFGGSNKSTLGAKTTTASSTTASIFGSNATTPVSAFDLTTTTSEPTTTQSISVTSANTPSLIFGTATSTSPQAPAFGTTGNASPQPPAFATTSSSVFSPAATTKPSVFSSTPAASQASLFGSPATTKPSIFSTSTTTTQPSIFSTPTTTTQTSIFSTPTTTTQPPAFGSTPATQSIFAPTTQSSVFAPTTQSSVFGATASTQASIFATSATTQSSIFGASTPQSVFGSAPTTTKANLFGSSSTAGATSTSPFAPQGAFKSAATTTTASSGFGSTFAATNTASPFAPTTTTNGSIFGQPSSFGSGSIFGGTPTVTNAFGGTSSASTFGNVSSTTNSTFGATPFGTATPSPFGATPAASPFGASPAASPFGTTPAASPFGGTPAASPFGAATSTASPFAKTTQSGFGAFGAATTNSFGFNSLSVGGSTTSTSTTGGGFGSSFGQNSNPFGRPAAAEQKPFSNSLFSTPAATTASQSIFGGASPFVKQSTFGSPPAFGSAPAFGAPSSTFGQTSTFGNSFGGSVQAGAFSSGGQTVQQSGFGSPASFQKPGSAFGSAPVFGSTSPGFGNAPSFGGTPAFGATPAFGSPQKVFGSPTTENAFGATANQNSSFGNMANQNTVGFGNLAQQATTPGESASSFSGGSSFSSWR